MVYRFLKQKVGKSYKNKHVLLLKSRRKYMFVLWTALILVFSLYPSSGLPENPGIPNLDKLVHFFLYLIFSLLWMCFISDIQNLAGLLRLFVVIFLLTLATEVLQQILPINRTASLYDGLANFIGFFSAIGIYRTFSKSGWT